MNVLIKVTSTIIWLFIFLLISRWTLLFSSMDTFPLPSLMGLIPLMGLIMSLLGKLPGTKYRLGVKLNAIVLIVGVLAIWTLFYPRMVSSSINGKCSRCNSESTELISGRVEGEGYIEITKLSPEGNLCEHNWIFSIRLNKI